MADIFISYRHEGGEALGQLIYERLSALGYNVFYDVEAIGAEEFPNRLYWEIEFCKDFILILPEHGLDRCVNTPSDWVRLEIRHALKHKKNIIPLMMRGFAFPENLPEDIRDISNYNGIDFSTMAYMSVKIRRICDFLKSKPNQSLVKSNILKTLDTMTGWRGSLLRKVAKLLLRKTGDALYDIDDPNLAMYQYYAYISSTRSRKDKRFALWLRRKIEAYRTPARIIKEYPDSPKRLKPIYCDHNSLFHRRVFWKTTERLLYESRYLIVVCTPNAAKSERVNAEIEYFKSLGRGNKIIPVILNGDPLSENPKKQCYPAALADISPAEFKTTVSEYGKRRVLQNIITAMLPFSDE